MRTRRLHAFQCRVPPCPGRDSLIALQPPAWHGIHDAHPPSTTTPYIPDPLLDRPPLFLFLAFSCFLISVLESSCSSVSGFFLGLRDTPLPIYNQQQVLQDPTSTQSHPHPHPQCTPHYSSCRRSPPPCGPPLPSPRSPKTPAFPTASAPSPTTSTCWPPRSRRAGYWPSHRPATSPSCPSQPVRRPLLPARQQSQAHPNILS